MVIQPTALSGVMEIRIEPLVDDRGLFARTYDEEIFSQAGLPTSWPQCNLSWNELRGTLRGMHYQSGDAGEPKLVRCTRGRIFDVAVDINPSSQSFKQWVGIELHAEKRNALYIPPGFAHGFLTLEDGCEVLYQMGTSYVPDAACGVRWDDPAFDIKWPFKPKTISQKDACYVDFIL